MGSAEAGVPGSVSRIAPGTIQSDAVLVQLHERVELLFAHDWVWAALRNAGRAHTGGFGLSDQPRRYRNPLQKYRGVLPAEFAASAFPDLFQPGIEFLMPPIAPRLLPMLLLMAALPSLAQEVVDRIAASVETDVILMSDIRALSRYQLFVDGKSESDRQILERLVDQWIVRNEAAVSRIAQPSDEELERSLARLKRSFSSPEEFDERRKLSGLSEEDVRQMVKSQLYLSNYLDSRFRPSIQIDDKAIQDFYEKRVIPRAQSRGQNPPTLEAAHDFIHEALVQRAINEQADKWLKESRTRVRVDIVLTEGQK
jgi:hypothetical protein